MINETDPMRYFLDMMIFQPPFDSIRPSLHQSFEIGR